MHAMFTPTQSSNLVGIFSDRDAAIRAIRNRRDVEWLRIVTLPLTERESVTIVRLAA